MIAPGRKIDARFPLKVVEHGELREAELAALLTRPTIVSVFMKLKTPSCDRQVEAVRTHAAELAAAGCQVIALSRDSARAHQRYARAHAVGFIFASDPEDRFARATDSLVEKAMYGRTFLGPARAAYLLGLDGTVLALEPKVDTADHGAQLRALAAHAAHVAHTAHAARVARGS
jgi:peroxiredoxin Q/BCP